MEARNDRMIGSLVGLAIGDALGVPLEFKKRDTHPLVTEMIGQGPFNLNPGEWTDDTSMALCIAESLIYHKQFNAVDIMRSFCQWWQVGHMSHNGRCFDIGTTTQIALSNFVDSAMSDPYKGSTHSHTAGNGNIMRLAPIPIFFNHDRDQAAYHAILSSRTTHGADQCLDISFDMGQLMVDLYDGKSWDQVVRVDDYWGIPRDNIKSTGYVVDTWKAALWAISNTNTFEDALVLAVNLADDSDTVGAVTGQLAGALYGYSTIPERWLEKLVWKDKIVNMAKELIYLAPARVQ